MAKSVQGKLFQAWTYDLWGNDQDGYEVNDRFKNEEVFIPNTVLEGTNRDFLEYLAKIGTIRLTETLKVEDIDIQGESDYTLYFEYNGKPDFELEKIADVIKKTEHGLTVYYNIDGTHYKDA